MVEFYNSVFGTIALIGKEILVRLRSPLISFFPMSLIISLPMDLILLTCFLFPQILPPFECPNSCRWSSSFGGNLNDRKVTCNYWWFVGLIMGWVWCSLNNRNWSQWLVISRLIRFRVLMDRSPFFGVNLNWLNRHLWSCLSTSSWPFSCRFFIWKIRWF